jgi:uroporphyrinogen III methyltransferase/synthase
MKRPCVYLVGAGPGDPSLITVRGLRCLAAADVVVYDHLVQPRLLQSAPPGAERIDVGAASPRPLQQEAISYLLAEKAREGRIVVRLKWGDPFVFDDGGKEALFLKEQGVPFEVVPGIPAAVGVPSYAGVPVTYPGGGDTLIFVRGHESEGDGLPNVNWDTLAALDGTIVCYAGARQLPGILEALLSRGRPGDEVAALIYNGSLPAQQVITGPLSEIAAQVRRTPHRIPAILVVGNVVALREHLRWFDSRPLFGRRILVTRSQEQAGELVDLLEELGAEAVEAPAIRIAPPEDYAALDEACAQAGRYDWIVFTSANAVDHFMRRLLAGPGDVRALHGVRLCAVGPATADRLGRHGIKTDLIPAEHRSEAVVEALAAEGALAGSRILLPRADLAREVLPDELRRAGAIVTEVVAYRTIPESPDGARASEIYRMLLQKEIDVVTFTSASTVRNFVRMLGEDPAADLLATTVVAAIGPVTAEAAQRLNIQSTIVPSTYTVPALVEAIVAHFQVHGSQDVTSVAPDAAGV